MSPSDLARLAVPIYAVLLADLMKRPTTNGEPLAVHITNAMKSAVLQALRLMDEAALALQQELESS